MDPGGSRPPAGWYPDPSGAPGQRYFDGVDWTPHVVATQRPGGQTVVVTGPNHALHAILTVNVRLVGADMAHRRLSQQAEGAGEAVVTRPGWYRNPAGPGHRYWDGRRWTIVSIPPTVRRPSFAAQHPVLICLAVLVGLSLVVAYWWFFPGGGYCRPLRLHHSGAPLSVSPGRRGLDGATICRPRRL